RPFFRRCMNPPRVRGEPTTGSGFCFFRRRFSDDFFLYSTVTGLVFAKLFFPNSDPWVGTLEAFAIYAVGFVARPVGAAIFGHYGDRIGRKSTLIATLLLMGLATFAVALVPTYESIGIWGAVLLTILRFIQGIGVGGEWGGVVSRLFRT